MSLRALLEFLRRELLPTPGRGGATLRVTLASLITVALVLMFRMPHSLVAFVVIYLITQEDTAATVLGSVVGAIALTLGFWTALLALEVSLDIPWLRICFFAAYFFVGLGWAVLPENGTSVNGLPRVDRSLDWIRLAARFPVRIQVEDPDESFRIGASAVATVYGASRSAGR